MRLQQAWKLGTYGPGSEAIEPCIIAQDGQPAFSFVHLGAYNPRVIPSCAASFRWPSDTHVVTHWAGGVSACARAHTLVESLPVRLRKLPENLVDIPLGGPEVHRRRSLAPEPDPPVETVVYNYRDKSIQAKLILPRTTAP
jgi:hypothetical protein